MVKTPKLMLTDLERIVYDRCNETGDVPATALKYDTVLLRRIVQFVASDVRMDRITDRLERSVGWLKAQNARLRAGVRDPEDEPGVQDDLDRINAELAEAARLDAASEAHGV